MLPVLDDEAVLAFSVADGMQKYLVLASVRCCRRLGRHAPDHSVHPSHPTTRRCLNVSISDQGMHVMTVHCAEVTAADNKHDPAGNGLSAGKRPGVHTSPLVQVVAGHSRTCFLLCTQALLACITVLCS